MNIDDEFILYGASVALPYSDLSGSDVNGEWGQPVDNIAIHIKDGKIFAIINKNEIPPEIKSIDLMGGIIAPGFIDTQVNGGGDVLFNDQPDIEGIREIFAAHKRFGTTAILPTLISDDFDKMRTAISTINNAVLAREEGIIGIHLEGPFLNNIKKGIHDETKFKTIDTEAMGILTSLENGVTLATLAPEKTDVATIKNLAASGVIIAAGHTNATNTQTDDAIDAGLKAFTHLYNAMSQLNSREVGAVGTALQDNGTISGIIIDGVHVSPEAIKIAYKCLGPQRLMLVTDAMPVVGGDDEFVLYGKTIHARDGSCFDDNGVLAGSALDMASAVRNAHQMIGIPIGCALQMASQTPARLLGLDDKMGAIKVGLAANLVHLTANLLPNHVWVNGVCDICA